MHHHRNMLFNQLRLAAVQLIAVDNDQAELFIGSRDFHHPLHGEFTVAGDKQGKFPFHHPLQGNQLFIGGLVRLLFVFRRLAQLLLQRGKNPHPGHGSGRTGAVGLLEGVGNGGHHADVPLEHHLIGVHPLHRKGSNHAAKKVVFRGCNTAGSQAKGRQLLRRCRPAIKGIKGIQLRHNGGAGFVVVIGGRANLRHGAVHAPIGNRLNKAGQDVHPPGIKHFFVCLGFQVISHLCNAAIGNANIAGIGAANTIVNGSVFDKHAGIPSFRIVQ